MSVFLFLLVRDTLLWAFFRDSVFLYFIALETKTIFPLNFNTLPFSRDNLGYEDNVVIFESDQELLRL
jgi:hypothetical protein